jgi:hypothetical protein
MAEEDKNEKGFIIKDRRIFDDSGVIREEKKEETQEPQAGKKEKSRIFTKEEPRNEEQIQKQNNEEHYPEVNFASFILSLSTTAMYHFGDFPDSESNQAEINLPAAKQTIDILGLIKEKTQGNLDENENNLLQGVLYELRLRYVKEKTKG